MGLIDHDRAQPVEPRLVLGRTKDRVQPLGRRNDQLGPGGWVGEGLAFEPIVAGRDGDLNRHAQRLAQGALLEAQFVGLLLRQGTKGLEQDCILASRQRLTQHQKPHERLAAVGGRRDHQIAARLEDVRINGPGLNRTKGVRAGQHLGSKRKAARQT